MRLELTEPCALCELDITELIAYVLPRQSIEPPPRFPAVRRDLALVIDREFPVGSVVRTVAQVESPLLEDVELFDVYEGEPIATGKKSVALALNYRAKDRTLTDEEVNRAHAALSRRLRRVWGRSCGSRTRTGSDCVRGNLRRKE